MTFTPDLRRARVIFAAGAFACAAVLSLLGCSGSAGDPLAAEVPGSEPFVRLIGEARVAVGNQNLRGAGQLLDQAMAVEPDNPALWVEIARLRYRGGEHVEALAAAERAVELGPQFGPALLLRAQFVRDAHGLAASLPWYEAASAAAPENPEILVDYAATLGDLGRNRAMLAALGKLAEFAPDEPRAGFLSAVLAARAGNAVLARSLLERSGLLQRQVPAAVLLDALVAASQGNHASAAERLEQLTRLQPDNPRARELLAREMVISGRDSEVIARFGGSDIPATTSPYLAMLVGRAHERLGARDKAAMWLDYAQRGASGQAGVLPLAEGLAPPTADLRRAALAGDWSGAASTADALRQRFPGSADIAALAGDAALGRGDAATALRHYAAATKVRRSWPLARKAIAAYRQLGDEEAADVLLIRHVAGDRHNIDALIMLAQRRAAAQDWGRTGLLLDHVTALGGGNDRAVQRLRG